MGEHIGNGIRSADRPSCTTADLSSHTAELPSYPGDMNRVGGHADASAPGAPGAPGAPAIGGPAFRPVTRRAHALGTALLLLCTAAFCVPLWGEIRARLHLRLPDAPEGALGIGTAIGWSTATLANLVTVGVLGVLFGVLGALALRHRTTGATPDDFTGARRAYTAAWGGYVLAKLTGQGILALFGSARLAAAVPSLTSADAGLALLFAALVGAGRMLLGATWARALSVAGGLTALYTATFLLLPA